MSERQLFTPDDPADMEDELRERSQNIEAARDAAFERGQDAYAEDGDRDALAMQYFPDHEKLRADFCEGWRLAALDEAEWRARTQQ